MMRKDVKVGFAIGGVLLAVLVVYVLVGTGNNAPRDTGATIVSEDSAGSSGRGKVADSGIPGAMRGGSDSLAADPKNKPGLGAAPTTGPSDALSVPREKAGGLADGSAGTADPNSDLWTGALDRGRLMMSETPSPTRREAAGATAGNPSSGADPAAKPPVNIPPATIPPVNIPPVNIPPVARETLPTTQPDGTADRGTVAGTVSRGAGNTHVVQKNETLVKIAEVAYGNGNFWPAIKRANPSLDERKMRPGMTIVLPPLSEVKPDARRGDGDAFSGGPAATGGSSAGAPSIDPKFQYRVESNDSLHRISTKLYGKAEMWQKIYELNKEAIGPDPAKLKLNTVLKLPEPPTEAAAR